MPIQIVESVEPLSDASSGNLPKLIESDASRLLTHELERYCRGEVTGRSFLVSGHRGAGKTMLVAQALQKVSDTARTDGYRLRPLFIPLHGPNLLPNRAESSRRAANGDGGVRANVSAPSHTVLVYSQPALGKVESAAEPDSEMQSALKQMTLGLHRALVREVVQAYRARIALDGRTKPPHERARWIRRALELAAQLEIELYECPSPARLREFWHRPGFLDRGVLDSRASSTEFGLNSPVPIAESSEAVGRGFRELVALAGICEAYRRIAGTFTQEERHRAADDAKTTTTVGVGWPGKDLYGPLLTLLAGSLVGVGLRQTGADPYASTLSGIAAALGSAVVMKYASTHTRERSASREYTFLFDLSVTTLDRVLPILVERLRDAGLAPVFVVDELDKVDELSDRVVGMVHHLKKFVAESAFFIFITDRSYFEALRRRLTMEPFPVEHTYFGHHLFIVFRPRDLHAFLREVIRDPRLLGAQGLNAPRSSSPDEADYPLLGYILLHRAQMHPIDLRREITELRGADGNVRLPQGVVRSSRAYQFDLRIQLAVEIVLMDGDFAAALEQDQHFRRIAYDAMYYASREWYRAPNEPLDLGSSAVATLRAYLLRRMGSDRPGLTRAAQGNSPYSARNIDGEQRNADYISIEDCQFLLERIRVVAQLLANDDMFRARLKEWNKREDIPPDERVPQPVLDALGYVSLNLLALLPGTEYRYEWQYHPAGRPRTDDARTRVMGMANFGDWRTAKQFVVGFDACLAQLTPMKAKTPVPDTPVTPGSADPAGASPGSTELNHLGFSELADRLRVVKTTPAWKVVEGSIKGLEEAEREDKRVDPLDERLGHVVQFREVLRKSASLIANALLCGTAVVGSPSDDSSSRGARMLRGLRVISRGARFEELDEEEVCQALHHVRTLLKERFSDLASWADTAPPELERDDIENWRVVTEKQLQVLETKLGGITFDMLAARTAAWGSWRQRLSAQIGEPVPPSPTLDELLCGAAEMPPTSLLRFDLRRVTLGEWHTVLYDAIAGHAPKERAYCPPWMAPVALHMLGFRLVLTPRDPTPVEWLGRRPGIDDQEAEQWLRLFAGPPPRINALLLRPASGSLFDDWLPSPSAALLPLTSGDVKPFV